MFNHLHCHTEYSTLDGFGSPKKWAKRVKEMGMGAIAITEHGNIDSSIKMAMACKEEGVKFVAGCEFYICPDVSKKNSQNENKHICLYAMNKDGWRNILKLLSKANIYGYHYRPRIDPQILLQHLDGVVISTACIFGFLQTSWGKELFKELINEMEGRLFLEIMPHNLPEQKEWNKTIIKYSEKYNLPVIATNDAHYPLKEDAELQEVCLAINSNSTWDDPKRFKFDSNEYYLKSEEEMFQSFKKYHPYMTDRQIKKSLRNTQKLIDLCDNFYLEKIQPNLPISPNVPIDELKKKGLTEDDYFRKLVRRGLQERRSVLCRPLSEYKARIEEELDLLIKKKFTRYFLMVTDILDFCRRKNIQVGPGRGSVGGCLVAWLLGITQIDPLKYNLLFARFQDPTREDLPDIDIDFEQDRREEVVEYIRNTYGKENVAQITTFLTMKTKMALQDVGRVFGVPRGEISKITKLFDDNEDLTIESFSESENEDIREFYINNKKIIELAIAIKDTVRGYGKHAAGVCISEHNLSDGINGNLAKRQGILVSNWDKDEGEFMGLMKLDCLGLTALSRIRVCCEMIKENHGVDINLQDIDVEDAKSLATINRGDCVGIFQLGTYGLTKFCQELGIQTFKDVYNATALYRPGTLGSGMAMEFVKRKHGESYKPMHPKVELFTKDTEGIILYQEQCMFLFKELAGFDWGKCNKVRKVIAKSKGEEALSEFKSDFINGCIQYSGMGEDDALEIWNTIVDFSKYAFNLSHSVEYSVISMWDAWLKTHYRGEFYASCLSYLDQDKRTEIIEEAADKGINVILPKIHLSDSKKWKYEPENKNLVMPFIEIEGIGEKIADEIATVKNKVRKTFFGSKANLTSLPSTVRMALSAIHAEDNNWKPEYKEINGISKLFKYNLRKILF